MTAFHNACEHGHLEVTAFHYACEHGHLQVTKLLTQLIISG